MSSSPDPTKDYERWLNETESKIPTGKKEYPYNEPYEDDSTSQEVVIVGNRHTKLKLKKKNKPIYKKIWSKLFKKRKGGTKKLSRTKKKKTLKIKH